MTDWLALPPAREIRGALDVPPSKSATNRALVAAALAGDPVEIVRPLESEDTAALLRCLAAMGASIVSTPEGLRVGGPLRVDPMAETVLDAGASGTAARFLAGAAAATPGVFLLTGTPRLRERPIGELVAALRSAGARIEYRAGEGRLPIVVRGGLRSGEITVDASRSSQFVSALLIAGIAVDGGLAVRPAGAVASRPYVATTIATLRDLGHAVEEGEAIRVARGERPAARYEVPGDYSSGVALLAAVGAAGGAVTLRGLRWPSPDADARALPVLEAMGVRLAAADRSLRAGADAGALRAVPSPIAATDFPDAVPVLAALAALAHGPTRFSGIAHLRLKESDRLAALAALLSAAGAEAAEEPDGIAVIGPVRPAGSAARLPTFDDHRLVMAAAILSLAIPGLLIERPGGVAKSYPAFFQDLEELSVRGPRG